MLAEERRFQIREILAAQRTVSASELCELLKVTPATIRRDLAALQQEGVLLRSHGGAVSRMSSTNFQPSYDALLRTNNEEKRQIARAAEEARVGWRDDLPGRQYDSVRAGATTGSPPSPHRGHQFSDHRLRTAAQHWRHCSVHRRGPPKRHLLPVRRVGATRFVRNAPGQGGTWRERD